MQHWTEAADFVEEFDSNCFARSVHKVSQESRAFHPARPRAATYASSACSPPPLQTVSSAPRADQPSPLRGRFANFWLCIQVRCAAKSAHGPSFDRWSVGHVPLAASAKHVACAPRVAGLALHANILHARCRCRHDELPVLTQFLRQLCLLMASSNFQ